MSRRAGPAVNFNYTAAKRAIDSFDLSPINRQVASYWLSLWNEDRPPRRADFDLEWLADAAAGIAVFAVIPARGVTCRFAGAAYKFRFGFDIQGKDWIALARTEERAARLERYTAIVLGAVGTSRQCDPNREGETRQFADVVLPFSNLEEDGTRFYLLHSDWRPLPQELRLRRPFSAAPAIVEDFRCVPILDGGDDARMPGVATKPPLLAEPRAETLPRFDGENVAVVDDDDAIREVITLHLEAAGLKVTAFESARALLQRGLNGARCIVSDVRMPDIDGLELQEELNRRKATVPFIVVTAHGDIPLAVRAMRAGAVDVLEKPFRPAGLLGSIERALRLGSETAQAERNETCEKLAHLTAREREVLERVARGRPSKAIASELGISQRTVDGHRASVMHKLNARTVGELVRKTVSAGVV